MYANPERAGEYRALALQLVMKHPDARAEVLRLADCYERLAANLECVGVVPTPDELVAGSPGHDSH